MTRRPQPQTIPLRHGMQAQVFTYADLGRKKPRKRAPKPKPPPPEPTEYDEEPW